MASVSDGELIRRALQEIVDSTLASPLAVSARETALKLLQWSLEPANHQEFFSFAKELISTLQKSAKELENAKRSLATRRERTWSGFHALRTTVTCSIIYAISILILLHGSPQTEPLCQNYLFRCKTELS